MFILPTGEETFHWCFMKLNLDYWFDLQIHHLMNEQELQQTFHVDSHHKGKSFYVAYSS